MAGLIDPNAIVTARQAGYSDPEIASFLTEKHPDQFMMAREAGYSDTEILQHLSGAKAPAEKGSGVVSGFKHGVAGLLRDSSSTLKEFAGVDTGLGPTAAKIDPKDHKSAPLIREGGSFMSPSDYNPSALPQIIAEQAPGVGQDLAATLAVGKINKWAGLAAGVGSSLLRTLGPMAKENAKARTGKDDAEVTSEDKTRAGLTSAVQAPLTAVGLSRFAPGMGKVAGVGMEGAGNALKKYMGTIGTEAVTGGARDAIGQVGTSIGQEHGQNYDPNRTAEAIVTGGAGSALLAGPKLAGNVHMARKFSEFGGANAEAATALANRQATFADGKELVGPLGGTKNAAHSVASAHSDVHTELSAATKGETTLSTGNANTLKRINDGGKASKSELEALGTEAAPETMHLARQALLSAKLKDMGNFSENAFTGGLSGAMERLRPISNPVGTAAAMGATALAGHAGGLGMLGTFAPQAVAGIVGAYGGARLLDKMTGARSPAKGFQDKFADPNAAPVTNPAAPAPVIGPQATTSVPQVAPPQNTSLWGNVAPKDPKYNPRPNIMIDEGIGKAVKQIQAAKQKQLLSDIESTLRNRPQPEAEPEPTFNHTALQMLHKKLKQGLPPEPAPAPVAPEPAPAAPEFNGTALKMLQQKLKQGLPPTPAPPPELPVAPPAPPEMPSINPTALKMVQQKMKQGLPPEPVAPPVARVAPVEVAPPKPDFHPTALKMLQLKLKAGLPAETVDAPAQASAALAQPGPASPEISALMAKLKAKSAPAAPPAALAPPADVPPIAPQAPTPPVIAKITKKLKGKVEEAAKPDPFVKEYVPLSEDLLWGKGMDDTTFAAADAAKRTDLRNPKAYEAGIVRDRKLRRGAIAELIGTQTGKNATHAAALLDDLHHITRAAEADASIQHFTKKMTPKMRTLMRARLDRKFINSVWKT